jgi:hypothetical protein
MLKSGFAVRTILQEPLERSANISSASSVTLPLSATGVMKFCSAAFASVTSVTVAVTHPEPLPGLSRTVASVTHHAGDCNRRAIRVSHHLNRLLIRASNTVEKRFSS